MSYDHILRLLEAIESIARSLERIATAQEFRQ